MDAESRKRAQQLVACALGYAKKKLPVFPLHYVTKADSCSCGITNCSSVGKHPITKNGFKDASTDDGAHAGPCRTPTPG